MIVVVITIVVVKETIEYFIRVSLCLDEVCRLRAVK